MEEIKCRVPCVSDLVRLECRTIPAGAGDMERLAAFDHFFKDTEVVPITAATFDLATKYRGEFRVKIPDAIHIAAAVGAGCDEFWTNDTRLSGLIKLIRIRIFPAGGKPAEGLGIPK
ncbi:PIN domain-containing protein [Candidatus Sumerlaeota bacterium]|nr:PIN domain-containing protein [Candidatus Sumerlaeota bacterium]